MPRLRPSLPRRLMAIAALATALAGCATQKAAPPPPAPVIEPAAAQRIDTAVVLLTEGRAAEARVEIAAALAAEPQDPRAQKLLAQIDTDPKMLLGEKSYPYRTKPGETLMGLAQRFLGDPLMFYALARYNQIDPPSLPLDGRTLMIPGELKPAPPKPQRRPAPKPPAPPAATAAQKAAARAADLRAAGLEQMNQGAINAAVDLLGQALALDPANAVIQRDLDRATRIRKTIQGH